MTDTHDKTAEFSPFVAADKLVLKDVVERLDEDNDLSPTRRRDLKSAIRAVARLVDGQLETTPANINWLHVRLRRVHPAQHGMSKKRFQNIKSDALRALELAGASRDRKDWLRDPSQEWLRLLDLATDKHDRWKLTQLAQYCSALEVSPTDVSDQHIRDLRTALIEESFQNKPEAVVANAVKTWNRLAQRIPEWPQILLAPPPRKKEPWTIPLEAFPSSFREDLDRWTDRLENPDLLDGSGPPKPLRPTTIKHRRFQVREVTSALVHSGKPIDEITHLSVLVDLENLKAALRWLMGRFGDKPTEAIKGVAVGLQAIARHHVQVPEEDLAAIKGIVGRLGRDADGLREKNRQRLLQLDDPANLAKLLHLPEALVTKAESTLATRHRKAALMMQAALAIEILLNAPMRVSNLSTLNLATHMRRIGKGRSTRTLIHIPAEQVKNSKALDYELGREATALLDLYVEKARPQLLVEPSDYLFPAMDGGPKRSSALSGLIKETILEHTGLVINAHLFRSIAGKIHSLVQPGDVTTLAYVLNDSIRTAMKAYAQFERRSALEHYQASVAKARRKDAA
jgi:site-specific recombinase XerD